MPQLIRITKFLIELSCILAAAFLCYNGKDGWGWFIFLAAVI